MVREIMKLGSVVIGLLLLCRSSSYDCVLFL